MENKPYIIFTIGNPCSGKSSFSNVITTKTNYIKVDDLDPLQEIFKGDSILVKNNLKFSEKELLWNNFKDNLKFTNSLWDINLKEEPCNIYSKPSETGGYNILDPLVWDLILKFRAENITSEENYIFEFSRGLDKKYLKMHDISTEQVYIKAFSEIISNIKSNNTNFLIINFESNFEDRQIRNKIRFEEGGHYISDKGMNEIYKNDIFKYTSETYDYLEVDSLKVPVVSVHVPHLDKEHRDSFFLDVYEQSLDYFNNVNKEFK